MMKFLAIRVKTQTRINYVYFRGYDKQFGRLRSFVCAILMTHDMEGGQFKPRWIYGPKGESNADA